MNMGLLLNGVLSLTLQKTETIPDPEFLSVLGQFLIVRPVSISEKIKGKNNFSLIMPETVKSILSTWWRWVKLLVLVRKSGARDGVSKLSIGDYIIFPKIVVILLKLMVFGALLCMMTYLLQR